MPEGGVLTMVCRRQGDEIIALVSDTGVGIAEEALPRIFEPLYTGKAKGIGLGLPLSQRYAQLNGGRIECESKVGAGAAFRFDPPGSTRWGKRCLELMPAPSLLADDDRNLCRTLRDVLAVKHHAVDLTHSGCGALAACSEKAYDVVLLDISFPDLSGLDLISKLEEIQPRMDILIITGHASMDSAVQAVSRFDDRLSGQTCRSGSLAVGPRRHRSAQASGARKSAPGREPRGLDPAAGREERRARALHLYGFPMISPVPW